MPRLINFERGHYGNIHSRIIIKNIENSSKINGDEQGFDIMASLLCLLMLKVMQFSK